MYLLSLRDEDVLIEVRTITMRLSESSTGNRNQQSECSECLRQQGIPQAAMCC